MNYKKPKRERVNITVHPKFNTMLKVESALNGKSIYDFTKDLGERDTFFTEYLKDSNDNKDKRRVKFDFKF